jgi:hypothetical protein
MAIPEEEEHKEIIQKNHKLINKMTVISIICLALILIFKDTGLMDKVFICVFLLMKILTLFICNIKWNQKFLLGIHYLYCIFIYLSVLSNNIYILLYFCFIIAMNIYIWHINDDSCIFGGLDWGNKKIQDIGEILFKLIPFLNILKVIYLYKKSSNTTVDSIFNSSEDILNKVTSSDNIEKITLDVLNEKKSFDDLHTSLSKIKLE